MPLTRRKALHCLAAGATSITCTGRVGRLLAAEPDAATTAASASSQPLLLLTRTIPSTNEALPAVGLGTWQTFDVGDSADERAPLEAVLGTFASLGGRLVDSSPMYGRSEDVAGEIAEKLGVGPKLFLATKVWTSGRSAGIAQMEASLRKLRAPRLDLMQVHNLVDVETHLKTLREWKEAGRIRYIGVTHYHAGSHDAVAKILTAHPIDFVQINYSVAEREAEDTLLPLARDRGIAVIVNRPFAGGALVRRPGSQPPPSWGREIGCRPWAQAMLKFVLSHPAVPCAIPATSKVSHLRDNLEAGTGKLPDAAMRARIVRDIG